MDAVGGISTCGGDREDQNDCYLMGFCGSEGWGQGSCKNKTKEDAQALSSGCAAAYETGLADWNNPETLPLCAFFDSFQCR